MHQPDAGQLRAGGEVASIETESRLHDFVRAQVDPHVVLVAVRDASGRVVDFVFEDANESAAAFHVRPVGDLVGRSVLDVLGREGGSADVIAAAAVLATGDAAVQNDEWSYVRERQDAPPTWLDVRISPVDPDRVSYAWRDVTERFTARQRTAQAHDLLRAVIDAQIDPHVILRAVRDGDGVVTDFAYVDANEAAARFEGLPREELLGRTVREVYRDGAEADGDIADCARVLESGEALVADDVVTLSYVDDQGRRCVVDIRVVAIDDERVSYTWRDVTSEHLAKRQLDEARDEATRAHELLRIVINAQVEPHVLLSAVRDDAGRIVDFVCEDANEAAVTFERLPREAMVGRRLLEFYASREEAEEDIHECARALEAQQPIVLTEAPTIGYRDDAGRTRIVDVSIVPIDRDRVSYTYRDVTDRHLARRLLAESEERFRLLAENMSDLVILIRDGIVAWASPSVTRALGWTSDELVGRSAELLSHPDDTTHVMSRWLAVPEGSLPRLRYRVRSRTGDAHWVDAEGTVVMDDGVRTVIVAARIVDAEVDALRRLEQLARHDELTGLVNRHAVFDQIRLAVAPESRSGERTAVAFCDLDGFKDVNDEYGHTGGDEVLRSVASRLSMAVRSGDVVSRIGGDELLIVLNGVRDIDDAVRIAGKLGDVVRQPVEVPGGVARVSASIGVTLIEQGESVDGIVARADAAMYSAKRQGKDTVAAIAGPTPDR